MPEESLDLNAAFRELARLLLEEETLETTLSRIGRMTVAVLPAADEGTVTVVMDGHIGQRASTGETARNVDDRQFSIGDGPCLSSMQEGHPIRIESLHDEDRWRDFVSFAAAPGVTSTFSLPLQAGDRVVGILNLCSLGGRFEQDDETLGRAFAREAAVAVANSRAMEESRNLISNLEKALETRDLIGRAVGVMMAQQDIDAEAAFDLLRVASQRENVKLRDVAQRVLDDLRTDKPGRTKDWFPGSGVSFVPVGTTASWTEVSGQWLPSSTLQSRNVRGEHRGRERQ